MPKTTKDIVEDLRTNDLQSIMYKLKDYDKQGNDLWYSQEEMDYIEKKNEEIRRLYTGKLLQLQKELKDVLAEKFIRYGNLCYAEYLSDIDAIFAKLRSSPDGLNTTCSERDIPKIDEKSRVSNLLGEVSGRSLKSGHDFCIVCGKTLEK